MGSAQARFPTNTQRITYIDYGGYFGFYDWARFYDWAGEYDWIEYHRWAEYEAAGAEATAANE